VVSANRRSFERDWFTGSNWIISPEAQILAETSPNHPFATAVVDVTIADKAKSLYPRDIQRRYL
jgi:predicted amidohydrolase